MSTEYSKKLSRRVSYLSRHGVSKEKIIKIVNENLETIYPYLVKDNYEQNLGNNDYPGEPTSKYQQRIAARRSMRLQNRKLSKMIRLNLAKKNKTASKVAKEIGVSEGTFSEYKSGKKFPGDKTLMKLFEALGVYYTGLEEMLHSVSIND
jgi:hypothetical protein|tara:strand:- start:18019 stop:18468 length:450 start_codon:yes stop_codon:yes gene_type:complete